MTKIFLGPREFSSRFKISMSKKIRQSTCINSVKNLYWIVVELSSIRSFFQPPAIVLLLTFLIFCHGPGTLLWFKSFFLPHPTWVSSLVVPGVPWHPQILAYQLTISQQRVADYAHQIILASPNFQTLRWPWTMRNWNKTRTSQANERNM